MNKEYLDKLKSFQEEYRYTDGDISLCNDKDVSLLWSKVRMLALLFLETDPSNCGACYSKDFRLLLNIDIKQLN